MADTKRVVELAIKASTGEASKGIKGLVTDLTGLDAKQLVVAGSAVAMGVAMAKAFSDAVAVSAKYQKAMAEVRTLTNATASETKFMSRAVQDLSINFGQVDTIMARANYNVVSAGFGQITEQTELLAVSAKAAIAGVTDVNTAAKVITQTLNAYKMSADEANWVSDILFSTVKGGVTTFDELSGSLGKVNAIAASAGVSFSEVAAAMAVLTKNGLNSEEAATALRGLIIAIGAASGESKGKLDALGVTLDNGLAGALAAVNRAAGSDIAALRELIPETRALNAAASAGANEAMQLRQQLAANADAAGSTNAAFKIMNETVDQSREAMIAAKNAAKVAWGETGLPGAKDYYDALAGFFIVLKSSIDLASDAADKIGTKLREAGLFTVIENGGQLVTFVGGPQAANGGVAPLSLTEQGQRNSAALLANLSGTGSSTGLGASPELQALYDGRRMRELELRTAGGSATVPRSTELVGWLGGGGSDLTSLGGSMANIASFFNSGETSSDGSLADMLVPIDSAVTISEELAAVTDEQVKKWEQWQAALDEMNDSVRDMGVGLAYAGAAGVTSLLGLRDGAFNFGRALSDVVAAGLERVIAQLILVKAINPFMGFLGLADGGTVPGYAFGGSIPRAAAGMIVPNIGQAGIDSVPIMAMPGEGVIKRDTMQRLDAFLNAHNNTAPVSPDALGGAAASVINLQYNISRPISYRDHLDLGENAVRASREASRRVL